MDAQSAEDAFGELRQALVRWVEIRCRDRSRKAALNLYGQLAQTHEFRGPGVAVLQAALTERLRTVKLALADMDASENIPTHKDSPQWLAWARQICECWPEDSEPDWSELLVGLAEDGNELLSACVSASLRDSLAELSAAPGLRRAAEQLAAGDLPCCGGLRLPPNCEDKTEKDASTRAAAPQYPAAKPSSSEHLLLGPIIQRLEQETDFAAQQFAERIRNLVPMGGDRFERGVWQRRLLHCLMEIDDQLARPGVPPAWLGNVRTALREVLTSGNEYVVLDRQLVRRSIRSQSHLAEAIDYCVSPGTPSHHIIRVIRPGYALRRSDGTLDVVQRAKVLLAQ